MNGAAVNIGLLKERPGETYGDFCDRLESAVVEMVESGDTSEENLKSLAFALMEAPSDFDIGGVQPFQRAKVFLTGQSDEVKALFRKECEVLPRGYKPRIDFLLGVTKTSQRSLL